MSWNHLFGGMMSQVGFNPVAFPPNAQIVSVHQNLQAQQQAQQQQQQQQQAQQQQLKREAPNDAVAGGGGSGGSSSNSTSAASAAAAAAAAAANMEFLTTIASKELLEELKVQSQAIVHKTISNNTEGKQQLIKHYRCNRHRHHEKCPFKMLAIQSEDGTFRVYKSGDHNHAVVPSGRATGNPRTNWIPMQTVRTADELESLRQAQRVTVHKTTFHGKNRHFRCNRHRHNERCMFKLLAVTESNGVISVFRSGEHNHPIQQISNCVY